MKYLIAAHPIQQSILELVATQRMSETSLRAITKKVGLKSPQQVKHHLNQMVKYGFLDIIGGKYFVGGALRKSKPPQLTP